MDGFSASVECGESMEEQSVDYNGFHHDTKCQNCFAFSPTGIIFFAVINAPGAWHDSQVVLPLAKAVNDHIGDYALCVDSGFSRSGDMFGKFVGPISRKRKRNLAPILRNHILLLAEKYISLRQASEWGMRALQGAFPRLKSRLPSNRIWRSEIIFCIVLIHNFRTNLMGLNQITAVFNPLYDEYINLQGYDKIRRYYEY